MKKLLFLVAMLTTPFVNGALDELERDGAVRVKCVGGYVFVLNREGGITQFMYYDVNEKAMRPLRCSQYRR